MRKMVGPVERLGRTAAMAYLCRPRTGDKVGNLCLQQITNHSLIAFSFWINEKGGWLVGIVSIVPMITASLGKQCSNYRQSKRSKQDQDFRRISQSDSSDSTLFRKLLASRCSVLLQRHRHELCLR